MIMPDVSDYNFGLYTLSEPEQYPVMMMVGTHPFRTVDLSAL